MSTTVSTAVPVSVSTGQRAPARWRRVLAARGVPEAGVFVAALLARLGVIFRDGGLHGSFGYDAAVYFAASDALTRGRMPYRDFVLIHPPAQMLALTPFAALTRVVSDESAFTIAGLAFTVLSAGTAVVVVRIGRQLGLPARAAVTGGVFYALWFGAVGAEYLTKLEPLGNAVFAVTVLTALRLRENGSARAAIGVGLGLGVLLNVKIWWAVPMLAVLGWLAFARPSQLRPRRLGLVLASLAAAVAAIDLPFFLTAPRAMWNAVVVDQLGRHPNAVSPLMRLSELSTVPRLTGTSDRAVLGASAVATCIAVAALARRAWRVHAARPFVALLLAQLVVVLAAPSWFPFYADYVAVSAAVTVAAAALPGATRHRVSIPVGTVVTAAAGAITVAVTASGTAAVPPFAGAVRLRAAVAHARCVQSDTPMALIELDALSRGLSAGCRNWVDVTGRTYGVDKAAVPRSANLRWQRDLTAYLRSGNAVILFRPGAGIAPASRAAIERDGVLARAGGHTVYRVR